MLTTLCIIFTTEAFYPKDPLFGKSLSSMTFAVYTLIISLFTGSIGLTKFFLKGPLPILPQNAPLAGLLSLKFFALLLLNTMFVVRTFCLEAAVFSSYRISKWAKLSNIDPLIPEEYRLIIYLLPGLLSVIINLTKLVFSMKIEDFRYFNKFPQFIISPMFCPLMFEVNPDREVNAPPVRVWKLGSIFNSVFIGCLPQILLVIMDQYRQVPTWYRNTEGQPYPPDSNALIKHPHGNTIFSITSLLSYLLLTIIFFAWERIFNKNGFLCKICKTRCTLFPPNPLY